MSNIQVEATKLATMWTYKSTGMDNANKNEFDKFYSMVKAKDTREVQVKALNEASKGIVSDTQRRGFTSMMRLAVAYTEVNTVCNYSMVEWENLKRVVRLHKYVKQHHNDSAVSHVQDKLSKVYEKGMSPERYNNGLSALLDTLKEEYTVVVPKEVTYTKVYKEVEQLSDKDKEELLAKLMLELGYEVELDEVAA